MPQGSFLFPASFAQQRLWFLDQMMPDTAVYNMSTVTQYSFAIDAAVFSKTVNEIVRRHESLRTTFKAVNGQPFQLVDDSLQIEVPLHDLTGLDAAQQEIRVQQLTTWNAVHPFDLQTGPLVRATLVRRAPADHLFLLAMHHIISDAWSVNIFFNELRVLYEAFVTGKPSPLAELPIQYADYAVWQRDYLSGEALARQMDFWKHALDGLAPLPLPLDRPRPAFQSFRGRQYNFTVPESLAGRIRQLSQQQHATVFMTLFACFVVLLHRYARQDDIAIGVPVAGRSQTELEQLIGFFVNSVVIRTKLSPVDNFLHLLQQVRQQSLSAFEHGDLPFEKLVEELHPERDLSRNPLFQVLFQMTAGKEGTASHPTAEAVDLNAQAHISKFDLTLSMSEQGGGLSGYIEYNTDLFFETSIGRIVTQLLTLMESVVEDPEKPIYLLDWMSADEKEQMLRDLNRNDREYDRSRWVHELISEQAARHPDAVAIFSEGEERTFGWLEACSNQLSHLLIRMGIAPDQLVAVALPRNAQMVAVHLAVLKAGAAFVPIDTAYPRDRIAFVLEDLQPRLLITSDELLALLPPANTPMLLMHDALARASDEPREPPQVRLLQQHRAYAMYTSGSTGQPKGVELHHGGLLNLVHWNIDAYRLTANDRCLQMATPAYDAYVYELFPALAAGAALYMADDLGRSSAEELRKNIIEKRLTVCCLPTVLGEALLQEPWDGSAPLRLIGTAGDRLSQVPDGPPPFEFFNLYGPTENTVIASFGPVAFDGSGPPSIGRGVANVQLYVLDDFLQPVPAGVVGELYVGGASVGRGYLQRPRLTAERFVPDPFADTQGARLYRTGDLVRWRGEGALDFVGRADHQVKLRGFRIELEEVEKSLLGCAGVREAVAVLQQQRPGAADRSIIAYVATDDSADTSSSSLRASLRERLPTFMVPAEIVVLPALPKSMSGKIDRKALLQQSGKTVSKNAAQADTGAKTPLEKAIANVWTELLPPGNITVERNFFDIGGHSLMMARVQHRLRQLLQRDVPLVDLFQYPTIRSLSQHLESSAANKKRKTLQAELTLAVSNK